MKQKVVSQFPEIDTAPFSRTKHKIWFALLYDAIWSRTLKCNDPWSGRSACSLHKKIAGHILNSLQDEPHRA